MAALLRLAAMLVFNAARPLRMLLTLLSHECHTDVERNQLPAMASDNLTEEEPEAAPNGQPISMAHTSLNESFSGKARSAASRESRFERRWDQSFGLQFPSSGNRDSRDALRLPENDNGCCWEPGPGTPL